VKLSKSKFSAEDLDNISTDAHINHSVILAGGADKNPAGALHLDSLFDQNVLVRLSHAMGDHPGRAGANGAVVLRASYDRVFQTPAVENLLLASSRVFEDVSQKAVTLPVLPSRGNFVEGA
jgi:hypothetical protein